MGFLLFEGKEEDIFDDDGVFLRDDEPFVSKRSDSVMCFAYFTSTITLAIGIVVFVCTSIIICASSLSFLITSTSVLHRSQVITLGLIIQCVTSIGIFHLRRSAMRQIHQILTFHTTISCINTLQVFAFMTCLGIYCGAQVSTNLLAPIFQIENVPKVLVITGISSLSWLLLLGSYRFDKCHEDRKRSNNIEEYNFPEYDSRPINWLIDDVVDL